MKPMLAQEIEIGHLDSYLENPDWVAQQKLDGDRILIDVTDGTARALNRNGEPYRNPFPRKILNEFSRMRGSWLFDGEILDGEYWVFDLVRAQDFVSPNRDLGFRLAVLNRFFAGWSPDRCVRLLPTAFAVEAKHDLADQVLANNGEGLVLKCLDAPYVAGKRSSSMLKAKFTRTADVVVTAVSPDGRANMMYGLFDNGQLVEVGSCGTAGKPQVQVGDVVEVRYLYAGSDGRLVQPRMLHRRDDKQPTACTIDQLQFTNRDVVVPDERPIHPTSAAFVSRLLREAGIPKASPYRFEGRERDGFEVRRDSAGEIVVLFTPRYGPGHALAEQARAVLAERDLVVRNGAGFGLGGRYAFRVKGRRIS